MSFELLTDHLEPRFGNIYEYNLDGGRAGRDLQEWTDELRDAVRNYLLHEIPSDVYDWLFRHETDTSLTKESQIDQLLVDYEPWGSRLRCSPSRRCAVPTLAQLIGNVPAWQDTDQRQDAAMWLYTHANAEQRAELARVTNHPERDPATPWYKPEPRGHHFSWKLPPPELLAAWRHVSNSSVAPATVRAWARANGYNVGERGRMPKELIWRYEQARSSA